MTPQELVAELQGTKCRCGKSKKSRHTFCQSCYHSLPPTQRWRLYDRIGEGYEKGYAAACATLGFEEDSNV